MNWRARIVSFSLGLVLILSTSVTLYASFPEPVPSETPRLITSRWREDDQGAEQVWYREENGLFEPYFAGYLKLKEASFCNSLLESSQLYSLNKMLENKYISPEQRAVLIRLGEKLKPEQFRFYELLKTHGSITPETEPVEFVTGKVPTSSFPLFNDDQVFVQAALWSVSGQLPNPRIRRTNHRLPWQLDDEFKDVPLDRSDYEFTFEMGRGAQEDPRSIDILVKAAALGMLNEVMAFGGDLEKAYVFVHTLDEPQNRLFKMRKSRVTREPIFKVHASHVKDTNEVLVAKLSDILELLSPDSFSKRVNRIAEVGKMGWRAATEHLFALRDSMRIELDFIHPMDSERNSPIVLRNTTPVPGWFVAKVSEKYGVYENGPDIVKTLSSFPWLEPNMRGKFIVDSGVPLTREISKYKLLGISNLDPDMAKLNPDYTKLIVMASYLYYARELRAAYPTQAPVLLAQTRFALNSSDLNVEKQAIRIPGVVIQRFETIHARVEYLHSGDRKTAQPNYEISYGPGYIFDEATIRKLIAANPSLAEQAEKTLRKGAWQVRRHTSDAIGF